MTLPVALALCAAARLTVLDAQQEGGAVRVTVEPLIVTPETVIKRLQAAGAKSITYVWEDGIEGFILL